MGEMTWVREFIEGYKDFLPARERHGAYAYNLAVWYFRSFQTYLRRQKNIGYQRDNYLNLLRFTRKLLRLADGESKAALRQEIRDTPALAERAWLLERCGGD